MDTQPSCQTCFSGTSASFQIWPGHSRPQTTLQCAVGATDKCRSLELHVLASELCGSWETYLSYSQAEAVSTDRPLPVERSMREHYRNAQSIKKSRAGRDPPRATEKIPVRLWTVWAEGRGKPEKASTMRQDRKLNVLPRKGLQRGTEQTPSPQYTRPCIEWKGAGAACRRVDNWRVDTQECHLQRARPWASLGRGHIRKAQGEK